LPYPSAFLTFPFFPHFQFKVNRSVLNNWVSRVKYLLRKSRLTAPPGPNLGLVNFSLVQFKSCPIILNQQSLTYGKNSSWTDKGFELYSDNYGSQNLQEVQQLEID